MNKEQEYILKEKIKLFFRNNLPPIEAESAINTFEATIAAKHHDKESILKLVQQLVHSKSSTDIINI